MCLNVSTTEQIIKVAERVWESIIKERVDTDAMQFGFAPRRTTGAMLKSETAPRQALGEENAVVFCVCCLKTCILLFREVAWWTLRQLEEVDDCSIGDSEVILRFQNYF